MFLRFSKGKYTSREKELIPTERRMYRKCVFLGDSVVMEYGDKIVGVAKLHEETDKCFDYDVIVAKRCVLGAECIARFIKDMIGKSNKFTKNPSQKRRKYYVEEIDADVLPVKARIVFSAM